MWAPYEKAVEAVANIITAFKEKQLETSVIKEDKRQDKAIVYANKALDLICLNLGCLPPKVRTEFLRYKHKFDNNLT